MDSKLDKELSTLLVLAQGGDKKAYNTFLIGISKVLKGYLSNRIKEVDMIEDILQETLVSIHRAMHTYLPERPVGPWTYAICDNKVIDFYRKYRRIQSNEIPIEEELISGIASHEQDETDISHLIGELTENQKTIITLLKVDGLKVKEVAEKLNLSESNVKIQAFRGYEAIRRWMGVKKDEN